MEDLLTNGVLVLAKSNLSLREKNKTKTKGADHEQWWICRSVTATNTEHAAGDVYSEWL